MDAGIVRRQPFGSNPTVGERGTDTRRRVLEAALEEHLYKVIAELFGKDEGYSRGRGGGMHIGDFSTGNLGANAIVGGSVPIATGAAMARRYEKSDTVVCCFAGDGAYVVAYDSSGGATA